MRNVTDVRATKPKIRAFITDAANIEDETASGRINITEDDLVSNSLVFNSATSNSGEITVGAAIISGCNFTLLNDSGKFTGYNWTNTVVSIDLIYNDSTRVYMGYYYIVSHRESGKTIRVEALDAFKIMDIHQLYEVGITWPVNAATALTSIVNYSFKNRVTIEGLTGLENIILYDPQSDQMTLRDAVSYIAQACGKFATIKSTSIVDLTISFDWYDVPGAYDVGVTFSHDLRTDDVTVSGVTITDSSGKITQTLGDDSGYVIEIADNPFITEENMSLITDRLQSLVGLAFRPGNFAVETNAAIEAGDAVMITTRDEKNIKTIATNVTFKPFQLQQAITADCEAEAGDLQVSLANYIRRVAREEAEKAAGGNTGGGGGLAPEDLYKSMRPDDWLELPKAGENEIYVLCLIPSGLTTKLGFSVVCSTGPASLELGTVEGGSFVSMEQKTMVYTSYVRKTQTQIDADATVYGNKTHDGFCQVVAKITSEVNITEFSASYSFSSAKTGYTSGCVEIRQNLKGAGKFESKDLMFIRSDQPDGLSAYSSIPNHAMIALGKWSTSAIGSSIITSPIQKPKAGESVKFSKCQNLLYAGVIAESGTVSVDFSDCNKLVQFEKMDMTKADYATLNFENCTSLAYMKDLSAVSRLILTNAFKNCTSLVSVGTISSKEVKLNNAFEGCTALRSAYIENPSAMAGTFLNCASLRVVRLLLSGNFQFAAKTFWGCSALERLEIDASGWKGSSIDLRDSLLLTRQAVMLLFAEIPSRTSAATITLHADVRARLSDADIAVAENKGYTVTTP